MDPSLLPTLVQTVTELFRLGGRPMTLQALWIGESPVVTEAVTFEQMLAIIAEGRLGTHTRYVVSLD
jgi:hypothetical protein